MYMAVSKNTGVRKACWMGGMIRRYDSRYDSGYVSEVLLGMIPLMPQNMASKP